MRVRLKIGPDAVLVDVLEAVGRECVPVGQALAEPWDETQDVIFKPEIDASVVAGLKLAPQQPVEPAQDQQQALAERLRHILTVQQKGR